MLRVVQNNSNSVLKSLFVYLNIDDPATDEAKQKYGFRYQPHFLLIDENGEVVQEWIGSVNQGDFRVAIDTILSN